MIQAERRGAGLLACPWLACGRPYPSKAARPHAAGCIRALRPRCAFVALFSSDQASRAGAAMMPAWITPELQRLSCYRLRCAMSNDFGVLCWCSYGRTPKPGSGRNSASRSATRGAGRLAGDQRTRQSFGGYATGRTSRRMHCGERLPGGRLRLMLCAYTTPHYIYQQKLQNQRKSTV